MENTMTKSVKQTRRWIPLIVGAAALLALPHLIAVLNLPVSGLVENHPLAERPSMPTTIRQAANFSNELDAYVRDQFPPRAHLIGLVNFVRYKLGYSGTSKVFVGEDGWLFYNNGTYFAHSMGKGRLDQAGLSAWVQGLQQHITYLKSREIGYYVLTAPVKEEIYPEKRPGWLHKNRMFTETDDILRATQEKGLDNVIDPRAALIDAKGRGRLWDEFDTHWTGLGAYIAYTKLMERMSRDYPFLKPFPLSHFKPIDLPEKLLPRDLARMVGIANFVPPDRVSYMSMPIHDPRRTIFLSQERDWTAPQIIETDSVNEQSLLLLRDSFSLELLPFLKPHFRRIILAHVKDGFWRPDLIEKYKPNIVLLEVIENGARHTMRILSSEDQEHRR